MEQNNKDKQERTLKMQSKVLEYLAESGNISYSCKRAGINRDTFYTWKKEDKLFAENADLAVSYGKSFVNDLAHTQLIRLMQDGNMQAVRFQLLSCHDDYKPRRALPPQEPEDEKPVPITAFYITTAPPRTPTPAQSAPPKEDEKEPKRLVSPSAKPKPSPKPKEPRPLSPQEWKQWYGDDGFDIDRRDLLGPR